MIFKLPGWHWSPKSGLKYLCPELDLKPTLARGPSPDPFMSVSHLNLMLCGVTFCSMVFAVNATGPFVAEDEDS
jgi:hypothetical protein